MGNGEPENGWMRQVLERIEDHVHLVRRFMAESERRWQANHKILCHMLEEIRKLKARR
ncbi:MAG: hypothetical protein HYY17_08370 [Planctomycetes bacterium]|nr:hypothetical protein [Planctomycetota bacterium]